MQTNLIAKNNINFTGNKLVNEIIKSPATKEMADKIITTAAVAIPATTILAIQNGEINKTEEISPIALKQLKEELRQKMTDRGFSQNNIEYILSYTNKYSYKVAIAMVNDQYAHTSKMKWAIGYTTKENSDLMENAFNKKNYEAIYAIKEGKITQKDQIIDLSSEVIENNKIYIFPKNTSIIINKEEFEKERKEVLSQLKDIGYDIEGYGYAINEESIEVAKALLTDEEKSKDINYITWVLPYTNSENATLMLIAILNKDYDAVYDIQNGKIRDIETLEQRRKNRKTQNYSNYNGSTSKEESQNYKIKDVDVQYYAKLFNISEEQVLNMDKKTYRRLALRFHPDRNGNSSESENIFKILNSFYNSSLNN